MSVRGAAFCLALVLAATLAPSASAWAAERSAASGVALQTFEEGRKLFEQRQFAAALRSFEASLSLQPSPNTRLYIARCFRGLGKVASATAAFRLASREAEDRVATTGEQRFAATGKSASLEADELAPRVPRVALTFRGEVPEAAVLALDGAPLPRVAWERPLELDPGAHVLELTGPHLAPFRAEVTIAEGERRAVTVEARVIASARLTLRLHARPLGMAATLDGEPLDLAARAPTAEVGVGKHRVEVSAPGYAPFVWQGEVAAGGRREVSVELRAAPAPSGASGSGTPRWLFYSAAGVAVVAGGAGGVLLADAAASNSAEQAKPVAQRSDAARENVRTEATVASALLVGGGAAAIGALVLAFTTRWGSTPRERARVAVAPLGFGVAIEGGF